MNMLILTQRAEVLKRRTNVFPRKTASPTDFCLKNSLSKVSQGNSLLISILPRNFVSGLRAVTTLHPSSSDSVASWPMSEKKQSPEWFPMGSRRVA